jgi:hypothetical protein
MRIRPTRPALNLFDLIALLGALAMLSALLFPAVLRVRQAAARVQSMNNLKQLGLALHNHASANNDEFPAGVDANHFSATTKLLPYIEQDNLYKDIDLTKSIDAKANAKPRAVRIKTLDSPRDPVQTVDKRYGPTSYLYNDKVFFLNSKADLKSSFPDGTSNTIVIGETLRGDGKKEAVTVRRQHVLLKKAALKGIKPNAGVKDFKANKHITGNRCASWMDGRFLQGTFNGKLKLNDPRPDVSCAGAGGVSTLRSLSPLILVALGDGSVRGLNAGTLTFKTWTNALDPADGQPLGDDW